MGRSRPAASPREVVAFLDSRPGARLSRWTRDVLLTADPGLAERIAAGWGAVTFHHPSAGYVCGVFAWRAGVHVSWEHGVELFDPEGLLRGEGSQVRNLPIAAADEPTAQAIEAFLAQAIERGR